MIKFVENSFWKWSKKESESIDLLARISFTRVNHFHFCTTQRSRNKSQINKNQISKPNKYGDQVQSIGRKLEGKLQDNHDIFKYDKPESILELLSNYDKLHSIIIPGLTTLEGTIHILEMIKATDVDDNTFELKYFKWYAFLISQIYENMKKAEMQDIKIREKYAHIFYLIGKIYSSKGKFNSSFIMRFRSRFLNRIENVIDKFDTRSAYRVFAGLYHFSIRGSRASTKIKRRIMDIIKVIKAEEIPELLNSLAFVDMRKQLEIELCLDKSFKHINNYTLTEKCDILASIAELELRPNQGYFVTVSRLIMQDLEKLQDKKNPYASVPYILQTISRVERLFGSTVVYIEDLDEIYDKLVAKIKEGINTFSLPLLARTVSGLFRASYYDDEIILMVKKRFLSFGFSLFVENRDSETLKETIDRLRQEMEETKSKDPEAYQSKLTELKRVHGVEYRAKLNFKNRFNNLQHLTSILHFLAFNNHYDQQFMDHIYKTLQIYHLKYSNSKDEYIEYLDFSRITLMMWSLCVLDRPEKISEIVRFLLDILIKTDYKNVLGPRELRNLYLATLYLKDTDTFPQEFERDLVEVTKENARKRNVKISLLQIDVSNHLRQIGIEHFTEESLQSISVDIILSRKSKSNKTIIIEVHGFYHYFRNAERMTGPSEFKAKLMKMLGYDYLIISCYDWSLLEDSAKPAFLCNFLKGYIDFP